MFKNVNFLILIFGQIVSIFGSALVRFSLSFYILDITGRADYFAFSMAFSVLPVVIFSPIAGVIADRYNRRNLMILYDLANFMIVVLAGFYSFYFTLNLVSITITIGLLAIVSTLYQPSVSASVPLIVNKVDLEKANGIVTIVLSLTQILAPLLGGLLLTFLHVNTILVSASVLFILAAIITSRLHMKFVKKVQTEAGWIKSALSDLHDGYDFLKTGNSNVRKFVGIGFLMNLIITPFFLIGTPYVVKVLFESSSELFGVSLGIFELSNILGAIIVTILGSKLSIFKVYKGIFFIAVCMLFLAFAMSPYLLQHGGGNILRYILYNLFTVPIVMTLIGVSILAISYIQKVTPDNHLGKIMALVTALVQIATPMGQIIYGFSFELLAGREYLIAIILAFITCLLALLVRYEFRVQISDGAEKMNS